MAKGIGIRTPTDKLIHKLRLMADAGGMLTRDRTRVVIESADRLEELDERIAIMTEHEIQPDENTLRFPAGGEENEKH